MYRPDRSIVKQLREIDSDLDVRWDTHANNWRVTCLGRDVVRVCETDGSYRPLDGRVVEKMREQAWEYRSFFGTFNMRDRETHERNLYAMGEGARKQRDDHRQFLKEDGYNMVFGVGAKTGRSRYAGWSAGA